MWTISAFADEIADDLAAQLATLAATSIRWLDLRGVWGKNVLALSDAELGRLVETLATHGVGVAAVASPLGKIPITADFTPQLDACRRAITVARAVGTPYIRVFSFFMPPGDDPARHRDEVLRRLSAMVELATAAGVTLLHENEKEIYGDTPERCHDLLTTLAAPALRAVWDPANFVQVGVAPLGAGYALLRPYLAAVHIKDARRGTGEVVPPGAGDGELRETLVALRDSGFTGTFSLEPHLTRSGPFSGKSGPARFTEAATAFRTLLTELGVAVQ